MSRVLVRAAGSRRLAGLASRAPLARRVADRFIAGETLEDGVQVARTLAADGHRVSLDVVGERVRDAEGARAAAAAYRRTLDAVTEYALPAGISVKPSQLRAGTDAASARRLLAQLAEPAAGIGAHITVDMEDSTTTDATIGLVEAMYAEGHSHVGCALQAALHRTPDDVSRLQELGVSIRLCKGAYAEPAGIAHQRRRDVDHAYASLATRLLEHGGFPRFATHDHRLIGHVRAEARRLARASGTYEFQMLYGVRTDVQRRLRASGEWTCIYVPFGDAWFPYFMRRLAERPANVGFLLRALTG